MKRIGLGLCVLALVSAASWGCSDDTKPRGNGQAGRPSDTEAGASSAGADDVDPEPTGSAGKSGSAGAGASMGGAANGGAPTEGMGGAADPCEGVAALGECASSKQARACVVPTGNGSPTLVVTDCRGFEHCDASKGQARCVLNAGACVPEQTECLDAKQLRICDVKGAWHVGPCPGVCQASAAGAFCAPAAPGGTFNGKLEYEAFGPEVDGSDWAETSGFLPGDGVLVLAGDGTDWVDAQLADETGAFSVKVPTTSTGLEQLAFFLLHPDPTGAYSELGVFDPKVGNGIASTSAKLSGKVWSWSVALADIASGDTIQISEAQGSGAVHVYTRLVQVQRYIADFYQTRPGSLAAWLHLNTAWDCGACFAPWSVEIASQPFDSQLFISATSQDRGYWSDPVTVHEAGHYAMWSYGVSPNEGGQHCASQPTAPGQAWSEGWATGFSSILRDDPRYWDKQQGSMFWFDLAKREYDEGNWQRPSPQDGLLQPIDENEVGAMLWSLSNDVDVGQAKTLLGLQTASVTKPEFKRGYTRHVWDMQNCKRTGYSDTGESAPMFADYLDGLVCGGVSAAAIDRTTTPKATYPYPSQAPLCH